MNQMQIDLTQVQEESTLSLIIAKRNQQIIALSQQIQELQKNNDELKTENEKLKTPTKPKKR